ncbi:MAG: NAD(P)/FAD-dependent oxidoreductase [Pseudomonadota bacterium]
MYTDVIIIGAGPIGIFSAFQAGILGMKSAIIDSLESPGGQCFALYPEKPIYDIPGHPQISGLELIKQLQLQASPFHPEYYLSQQVTHLTKTDGGFEVITNKGNKINGKTVLIAAGGGAFGPNRPPLEDIEKYEGKSIFYSVQQTQNFRDKNIVIAGGGDSALDWTLALAKIANKIYLIHRRDKFRAAPESLRQLRLLIEQNKVELVVPYQLSKLEGSGGVLESVIVESLSGDLRTLEADILLPFFGLKMSLGPILDWGLCLDTNHISAPPPHYETNIPGIYAIGDIATYPGKIKLILTGFAEAAAALHHSYPRVFGGKHLHFQYSTNKGVPLN